MAVGRGSRTWWCCPYWSENWKKKRDWAVWGHTSQSRPVVDSSWSPFLSTEFHKARQLQEVALMATSWGHFGNCGPELCRLFYKPPTLDHSLSSLSYPSWHGAKYMINTQCIFAEHRKSLSRSRFLVLKHPGTLWNPPGSLPPTSDTLIAYQARRGCVKPVCPLALYLWINFILYVT